MTQRTFDLRNHPLPSRFYDEGLACPHCHGTEARHDDPVMDAAGFVWHVRCYVQFTLAYGEWLGRTGTADNPQEDYGDIHERDDFNPTEYHVTKNRKAR